MFTRRLRSSGFRYLLAFTLIGFAANGYAAGGGAMSETQTYCFGRFLIDLPKAAEINGQRYEYMFGHIETGRTPPKQSIHQDGFVEMMKTREEDLRAGKHEDKFKFVEARTTSTPRAKIFKIRKKLIGAGGDSFGFEAYLSNGGVLFSMKETAYDEDKIDSVLQRLETRLLPNLRARKPNEIPDEPGFCIKEGFIADDGKTVQYEKGGISFKFKEWPDVTVLVDATRSSKLQPTLSERTSKPFPAEFAEAAKQLKTLRQGKHDIGPLKGEELLRGYPSGEGYWVHRFVWDTQGQIDSASEPAFYFRLETGVNPGTGDRMIRPSLTDKQAIDLFDRIVKSIRLRPTTPGKSSDAGDNPNNDSGAAKRLPLKSKITSASNCPQTGIWECAADAPGITEHRRFMTAGQGMPYGVVQKPAKGMSGLLGKMEDDTVEITWTLIAYDEDKT